ncbi:MAG: type II toxin-antitoxin system death-on-curing family toxin, partial [bacterium]|nr:type II toxin-antitoxin system death-on-curing family toxin [bacterium]
ADHGGSAGIRDAALLDSALARPRHLYAYDEPDLPAMAASYAAAIIRNHPFIDGNKRTGFMTAYTFLARNGLELNASEADATQAVIALAASDLTEAQFARWLRDNTTPARHPSASQPPSRPPPARR